MYKKIILGLLLLTVVSCSTFAATTQDAMNFFRQYISAANSYNPSIIGMYASDAKIIREVVKPSGEIVPVVTNTQRYISEMKKAQVIAKVRNYKNNYSNIQVQDLGNNKFKVSSLRQPMNDNDRLKTYMIVQQKSNGEWTIVEEMMQTKVQLILHSK